MGKWRTLDARLIALHGAGLRPREVAAELGVTVSAVCGRAFKIGLKFGRPPPSTEPKPAPAPAPNILPMISKALHAAPDMWPSISTPGALAISRRVWPVHVAAYVSHVGLGHTQTSTALMIQRDAKLVSYAVRRIEDRRDDLAFDDFIERLIEDTRAALAAPEEMAA